MGNTTEDAHRGLNFPRAGMGPPGLGQSRCLVILEEPDEDCEDDIISEEEDKRLMERRNRRMYDERAGTSSNRSSTSTDCWVSTYKKLRRASELIGASAVAIDNKIEMAMDLVKNHLMYAVREEMDLMRDQIKALMERNKQLEEENVILRASTSSETFVKIFNSHMHPCDDQKLPNVDANYSSNNNITETGTHWLEQGSQQNPIHLLHNYPTQMSDSAPINMASHQFSPSINQGISARLVDRFQVSPSSPLSSHFVSQFSNHPLEVGHNSPTTATQHPQFFLFNQNADLDGYNVTWSPSANYKIILTKPGSDPDLNNISNRPQHSPHHLQPHPQPHHTYHQQPQQQQQQQQQIQQLK